MPPTPTKTLGRITCFLYHFSDNKYGAGIKIFRVNLFKIQASANTNKTLAARMIMLFASTNFDKLFTSVAI